MMSINNNWINEYPRPMLKRDSYYSLNGEWTLNNNKIIVPFPPQSVESNPVLIMIGIAYDFFWKNREEYDK